MFLALNQVDFICLLKILTLKYWKSQDRRFSSFHFKEQRNWYLAVWFPGSRGRSCKPDSLGSLETTKGERTEPTHPTERSSDLRSSAMVCSHPPMVTNKEKLTEALRIELTNSRSYQRSNWDSNQFCLHTLCSSLPVVLEGRPGTDLQGRKARRPSDGLGCAEDEHQLPPKIRRWRKF